MTTGIKGILKVSSIILRTCRQPYRHAPGATTRPTASLAGSIVSPTRYPPRTRAGRHKHQHAPLQSGNFPTTRRRVPTTRSSRSLELFAQALFQWVDAELSVRQGLGVSPSVRP